MYNAAKTLVPQIVAFDDTAIIALDQAAEDEFRKANYPEVKANQEAAYILAEAAQNIQRIATARATGDVPATARVVRIKGSEKYYTEEQWRIPENAYYPRSMAESPDAHLDDRGIYIIPAQYPWGYEEIINLPARATSTPAVAPRTEAAPATVSDAEVQSLLEYLRTNAFVSRHDGDTTRPTSSTSTRILSTSLQHYVHPKPTPHNPPA